ncbi:MAG: SMP-30/gluconolactonase/LRE family protein [Planctomycetota bacterium]
MLPIHQSHNVFSAQATLGEGPLWDEQAQALWWIDIEVGLVFRYDPANQVNDRFEVGQRVGTIVLDSAGGILLAVANGFARFDPTSQALVIINDPEADLSENRFNDGKCDPAGRFWAGTMNLDPGNHTTGALYSLDSELSVRKHLSDVGVSNGIVWSADAKTMYYADSMSGVVDAFDYDIHQGTISNRRSVFHVPDELGAADGMSIDAEDRLWVAFWGGGCVGCIDPHSGQLLSKIEVPVEQPTACAFGGSDLRDLYITSARHALTDAQLAKQPEAGDLFVARVEVPGVVSPRFKG